MGVLGAARIVNKTWEAVHRAGYQVAIIGCRDVERGNAFLRAIESKLGPFTVIPRVGSYEDVIHASDVDVVYIPIPVTARDYWVKECVKAGKHVVGEKPPAATSEQLREWLDALGKKNLLYMDGTMFTHGLRLKKLKEVLVEHTPIKHIDVHITFPGSEEFLKSDIRVQPGLEPYGALGDVGWYCIRWILHLLDFAMPEKVSARIVSATPNGAITALEGDFTFRVNGEIVTAHFYCSFTDPRLQRVRVFTAKGVLTVPNCVNIAAEERPHFFMSQSTWKPEDGLPKEIVEENIEKLFAGEEENDFHYQMDHLWINVAGSLQKVSSSGPLVADPAKAKMYADYAYLTQKMMDKVMEVAKQNS